MSSQKLKQITKKLIKFLKQELGIPTSSIKLALVITNKIGHNFL